MEFEFGIKFLGSSAKFFEVMFLINMIAIIFMMTSQSDISW